MIRQKGFTLVELLLSMAFFSFILLFVVTGFIQINRAYTRGITTKEVQTSTRDVMDEISKAIRDSEAVTVTSNSLCIGSLHYVWNMTPSGPPSPGDISFADVGTEYVTIVRTNEPGRNCGDAPNKNPGTGSTTTLLPENLMIQNLSITNVPGSNSYRISVTVSTDGREFPGDFDPADNGAWGADAKCAVKTGDQFCFVARLDTVVTTRN